MLAEGVVERVLVLAPSTTIEKGLTEKFNCTKLSHQNQTLLKILWVMSGLGLLS